MGQPAVFVRHQAAALAESFPYRRGRRTVLPAQNAVSFFLFYQIPVRERFQNLKQRSLQGPACLMISLDSLYGVVGSKSFLMSVQLLPVFSRSGGNFPHLHIKNLPSRVRKLRRVQALMLFQRADPIPVALKEMISPAPCHRIPVHIVFIETVSRPLHFGCPVSSAGKIQSRHSSRTSPCIPEGDRSRAFGPAPALPAGHKGDLRLVDQSLIGHRQHVARRPGLPLQQIGLIRRQGAGQPGGHLLFLSSGRPAGQSQAQVLLRVFQGGFQPGIPAGHLRVLMDELFNVRHRDGGDGRQAALPFPDPAVYRLPEGPVFLPGRLSVLPIGNKRPVQQRPVPARLQGFLCLLIDISSRPYTSGRIPHTVHTQAGIPFGHGII